MDRRGAEQKMRNLTMKLAMTGLVALLAPLFALRDASADPNALWYIISEQCVPDQQKLQSPKPCELVDLAAGYVVLKDRVGATQFLVMPTARISGIESPELLAKGARNYWADAWAARRYVDDRAHHALPREAISLAVNSASGRTQNQLHIHVDCARLDVIAALREHAVAIGRTWEPLPMKLSGHDYLAMRLAQPELGSADPFVLLADGVPGARADMGSYTLVVVGDPDGFVLLAGHATGFTNLGSGEELQDHDCAAAR
jgi:CDP-diacylglycerol pyrophosphatase